MSASIEKKLRKLYRKDVDRMAESQFGKTMQAAIRIRNKWIIALIVTASALTIALSIVSALAINYIG